MRHTHLPICGLANIYRQWGGTSPVMEASPFVLWQGPLPFLYKQWGGTSPVMECCGKALYPVSTCWLARTMLSWRKGRLQPTNEARSPGMFGWQWCRQWCSRWQKMSSDLFNYWGTICLGKSNLAHTPVGWDMGSTSTRFVKLGSFLVPGDHEPFPRQVLF